MSNTGFQINGVDLINIYNTNGTKSTTNTGFQSNGNDLKNIFGAYISGTNKYTTTVAYTFGSTTKTDLKDFFLFATVPPAPAAPTSSAKTANSITVSWTAPTNNGGSAITSYTLTHVTGSTTTSIPNIPSNSNTNYVITGLSANRQYTISVKAVNAVGSSSASGTLTVTTNATTPSAPTSLSSSNVTSSSFTVNWAAPTSNGGSAITGYSVNGNIVTSTTFSYTFSGLSPGTLYTITIFAINAVGNGTTASINITTIATAPSVPTNFYAIPSGTSITIYWSAPSSNGGSAITGYQVGIQTLGWTYYYPGPTTTSYNFTGLTVNTRYTFSVAAINNIGYSTTITLNQYAGTLPGQPTNFRITGSFDNYINLAWNAASQGSSSIVYIVSGRNVGNVTSYSYTGLFPGNTYNFQIYAVNLQGAGPSNYVSGTTTGSAPGQ